MPEFSKTDVRLPLSDSRQARWRRQSRSGKISISALFVFLAFVILICFMANVQTAIYHKMESQNAADSMSLATTQWMARNLNATTANNHLLGELSAIVVVIESLSGSKVSDGPRACEDSVKINGLIRNPVFGPVQGLWSEARGAGDALFDATVPVYGSVGSQVRNQDQKFIRFVRDLVTDDKGQHRHCATILDGQLTIKGLVYYGVMTKVVANSLYVVSLTLSWIPGVEVTAASVNLVVHLAVNLALIPVIKDWYLTKGVELMATGLQPLREPVLPLLISGLSLFGDSLNDDVKLRKVVKDTLTEYQQQLNVASFDTFPTLRQLRLPIEAEPVPESASRIAPPPSLSGLLTKNDRVSTLIKTPLETIRRFFNMVDRMIPKVPNFRGKMVPIFPNPFRGWLDGLDQGNPQQLGARYGGIGFPKNPSLKDLDDYAQEAKLDWESERYSQWVRATYPQVDEFRRPICDLFQRAIPTSKMECFFVHWTNRHTISVSHRLRSSNRSGGGAISPVPPRMYRLMASTPTTKGREPWTNNPVLADRIFSIQIFSKLNRPTPILAPALFPNPHETGILSISQAMVYNANGRSDTQQSNQQHQPDTGWDTLNWVPSVRAFEWGGSQSDPRDQNKVGDLFSNGLRVPAGSPSSIQLNWNARLVPIGHDKLREAENVSEIRQFLKKSGQDSLLPDVRLLKH